MSEDEKDVDEAPPKKSKLVPMLLIVNTLGVAGVMVFTMTRKSSPAPAEAATKGEHGEAKTEGGHAAPATAGGDKASMGPTVRLDNFVVQLRAVETERYAHITLDVELVGESGKASISALMPKIRDSVIGYLSDRTADELRGSEGMGRLKDAVFARLSEILPPRTVSSVYVTDFIVQ